MQREVNDVTKSECLEFIRNNYDIKKFLEDKGLLGTPVPRGKEYVIKCPFHLDETPSLSIDFKTHRWHCFSCGWGGDYVSLAMYVRRKLENRYAEYSQILDELLRNDLGMQAYTGAITVFKREKLIDLANLSFDKPRLNFSCESKPSTFLELANTMVRANVTNPELIKSMILSAQDGYTPEDCYERWKDTREDRANASGTISNSTRASDGTLSYQGTIDIDEILKEDGLWR